jgi:uncharacterized protein (DUF1786 family)
MRILAVDVGTGTQDILLFDTERGVENCFRLVMPSPTVHVAELVREATTAGDDILLTGVTMGGGPCHWAVNDHLKAGHRVYATPYAARTFNDVLEEVEEMGVTIVSEDEAAGLVGVRRIEMRDFYLGAIREALRAFGVSPHVDAYAVAVFDHGNAPPGYSDRAFRFDYLRERLGSERGLAEFAFWADEIPERFTRLQAVADSVAGADGDAPLLVMDTGPAAVLGALEDARVAGEEPVVIVNIGNFHTLAFLLAAGDGSDDPESDIAGVFEHHTGELTPAQLATYLHKLAAGEITNQEVFDDMGHGALVRFRPARAPQLFAVTGPRRNMIRGTDLPVYLAVPHGDMMLAGCFGLVRAYAGKRPEDAGEIEAALGGTREARLW